MRPAVAIASFFLLLGPHSGVAQDEPAPPAEEVGPEAFEPAVSGSGLAEAAATTDSRRTASRGTVMDEIDLGRTEITGNQELPKVLYIVPWKQSDLGDLVGRPVNSLLDEVLAPVDREVFIRQVDYYQSLYADPAAGDEAGDAAGGS